jgi:homoserine kinase
MSGGAREGEAGASWPLRVVRVRVSATSANLGPGFDALGLALARYDEVEAEVTEAGLAIEVSGEGAEAAGAGEQHLVVRAMRAAFELSGGQPPGLALRCVNTIPQGRGLGSSAGAVVAGLLAARALAGVTSSEGEVLGLAARLEGHPDNAAACLAGGLTIAWAGSAQGSADAGGPRAVRLEPLPEIRPVLCVPATSLATTAARQALPETIPHRDAAANAGRSALLVAALTKHPDLLFDATEDLLHEPYRRPLMPASGELIARLRAAGVAAVLSGAGPSVLALTVAGHDPGPEEVDSIAMQTGNPWHVTPLAIDRQGATIRSVPLGTGMPTGRQREAARSRSEQAPAGHPDLSWLDRGSSSTQHGSL